MYEAIDDQQQGNYVQQRLVCCAVCDCIVALGDVEDRVVVPESVKCTNSLSWALKYLKVSIFSPRQSQVEYSCIYTLKDKKLKS